MGDVEVFIELFGKRAVVAGFDDVVPGWRMSGEESIAGAKPVGEEFTRQRIGEAEGDEGRFVIFSPRTRFSLNALLRLSGSLRQLQRQCFGRSHTQLL